MFEHAEKDGRKWTDDLGNFVHLKHGISFEMQLVQMCDIFRRENVYSYICDQSGETVITEIHMRAQILF